VIRVNDPTKLDFESTPALAIQVQVTDQFGFSLPTPKPFTINLTNVNEAPVVTPLQNSPTEDTLVSIAQVTDPEGGPVTLTNVTGINSGVHGTVSLNNGNLTYNPDANFSGVAEFDYTVSDAQGNTTTAHAKLDVLPVADTPTLFVNQIVAAHANGSSQFRFNSTVGGGQFKPTVARLQNGGFVAAWTDTSGQGGDAFGDSVKAQRFDANGNKIGTEFLVNTTLGFSQNNASITVLTNGGFVVSWEDRSGQDGGQGNVSAIRARVFDANGNGGSEILVNVNSPTMLDEISPSVTALTNNRFLVTWENSNTNAGLGGDGSGRSINAQLFDNAGTRIGGQFLVNTTAGGNQTDPAVTALAGGGFVVSWTDASQDANGNIIARVFDANGNGGSEIQVNTTVVNVQHASSITALTGINGGFVVTWEDSSGLGGDASPSGIKAQVFDNAGGKVGSEFLINTVTAGAQAQPSITALANGDFVAVWTDPSGIGGDASVRAIKAQVFKLNGGNVVKVGSEFLVNTLIAGEQRDPVIVALGANNFLVAWSDTNQPNGVQGQIFTLFDASQDTAVPLSIDARVTDTDGSERLSSVVVSGILAGTTLSDGTRTFTAPANNASVDIAAWNFSSLTVTPPLGFSGDLLLTVTATATDTATLSDGIHTSTKQAVQTLDITITPNATLVGGAGADTLTGSGGNDTLDGGAGADMLIGRDGNDTYVVDNSGDNVVEQAAQGTDTVRTALGVYTLGANVENLTYTGAGAFVGIGNELSNVITGGASDDILIGGAGADTLIGMAGNDFYDVDNVGDVVIEKFGEGIDTIRTSLTSYTLGPDSNVENLTYNGTGNFTGTGNALANAIVGGAGSDILDGGAGDDFLSGGGGTDTLIGGVGNDFYDVDNVGDVVVEQAGQGIDTVRTFLNSYTLGSNVENLIFGGAGNFIGTGNELGNIIWGGNGNDTLNGGGGDDALIGGAGNDTFVFGAGFGIDQIVDFTSGQDHIRIRDGQFTDAHAAFLAAQQNGPDVIIRVDPSNAIALKNYSLANLRESDFVVDPAGPANGSISAQPQTGSSLAQLVHAMASYSAGNAASDMGPAQMPGDPNLQHAIAMPLH
jgi:serralysin